MVAAKLVMWWISTSVFARRAEIQREILHGDDQWKLLKIMLVTEFCIVLLFFKKNFNIYSLMMCLKFVQIYIHSCKVQSV